MTWMCPECEIAHGYAKHNVCDPLCIHCGARAIKLIREMNIPNKEKRQRQLKVLEDWEKYGHPRERVLSVSPIEQRSKR